MSNLMFNRTKKIQKVDKVNEFVINLAEKSNR